ncbi:MAG: protein kinase [Myxococcaceae bacterium]
MSQPPAVPPGADHADRVQRYGKYFLIRKLAEGGMAEIFLAKSVGAEGFERDVVIKRMLKHLTEVSDFVKMFRDEARLAARLSHQNVVQIHELGLAEGCYYICMEYLAGEDFSTILRTAGRRREYVPIQLALRVIADAAQGLHYAHESTDEQGEPLNIVHRDVSPSNIHVTYEGQVKVLDFGIARAESRLAQTTAGVVKGKYMYMSPEQARGHVVDRRADVFSLGVSLFEALTNVRPFSRDNDLAILNAVLGGEFPQPRTLRPDLPTEVEQIVLKAMALKPEDRYATAAEMARAIERYLSSTTSNPGGAQLSAYMRTLFGEERVFQKRNVKRLKTLIDLGQVARGFTDPALATVAAPTTNTEAGTQVVGTPSTVVPRKGARWVVPLMLLGVAAVAGGGAFAWTQLSKDPVGPPAARDAGVAVAPATDAGVVQPAVAAGAPDAGPEEPTPEVQKPRVRTATAKRKPVKLTTTEVHAVLGRSRARTERCFVANRAELPSKKGQLHVQFSIEPSGRVSGIQVNAPFAGTKVGRCLADVVAKLKFPAHVDGPIALTAPFEYTTPE